MDTSSSDVCFICMEETNEPAVNLLDYEVNRQCQCSANLHAKCYARWLRENQSCPICREPILMRIVHPQSSDEVTFDSISGYSIVNVERSVSHVLFTTLVLLVLFFVIVTIILVFLYIF